MEDPMRERPYRDRRGRKRRMIKVEALMRSRKERAKLRATEREAKLALIEERINNAGIQSTNSGNTDEGTAPNEEAGE